MSSQPDDSQKPPKSGLEAGDVVDYLRAHPDFLVDHPEILSILTPPSHRTEGNVLDLQLFMLQKLQKEVRKLSGNWSDLIATSRSNMATQAQVHTAVLAILKSESKAELIHKVTFDFPDILNVDAVALCSEDEVVLETGSDESPVRFLGEGAVDRLMGLGRDILLRSKADRLDEVFGPAADLVRSDALIRLTLGDNKSGILALGTREEEKFHPGQGTELMGFLAQSIEICVGRWTVKPK
ncbi:MAG: DUF484 family protein [Rhodospirillales bacterium]|nr:DUF484 family protein [Rhodospirillales bacterium]